MLLVCGECAVPVLGVLLLFISSNRIGSIDHIAGTIHYIQPGGSSLMTRGLYTNEEIRAALTFKFDPDYFEERKKEKYIQNVRVDSPAVISVNMQASTMMINEFLSRIHGFREEETANYAIVRVDILNGNIQNESDGNLDWVLSLPLEWEWLWQTVDW